MSSNISINNIFDCHLHIQDGMEGYDITAKGGNIIFNSIELYETYSDEYPEFYHSVIFSLDKRLEYYRSLVDSNKITCLKVHSRLQKIDADMYSTLIQALKQLDRNVPIIYDAFYYGEDLDYQPNLFWLVKMIKAFPERPFVIAHAGGYQILKYFFHLREFENVGYDLSFSLQYLADSSCRADLIKLIKYTPQGKIFFGSDFPHASPQKQVDVLKGFADELDLNKEEVTGIFNSNWKRFLGV